MIKTIILFLVLFFSIFMFSGCNTFRGFAQDVQELGQGMEDVSQAEIRWVGD